ncbi:MAG: cell division protein ZapA [Acidobacteriota bacterium]
MGARGTTTAVKIFDSVYHIRGEADSETLLELADLVDRKMREIAAAVKTVDSAKIAILAAVNLADELTQIRRELEEERINLRNTVEELTADLDQVLEP